MNLAVSSVYFVCHLHGAPRPDEAVLRAALSEPPTQVRPDAPMG